MAVTGPFRSDLGREGWESLLTQLPHMSNRGNRYLVLGMGVRSNNTGMGLGTLEVTN